MSALPEPLLWILLAVALAALVLVLVTFVMQIRRGRSVDDAARARLQRDRLIACAVGSVALGTITIANLASRVSS